MESRPGIEKVFTFDEYGNILNFKDYYYHVNDDSTNIKIFKEKMHVADIEFCYGVQRYKEYQDQTLCTL